MKKSILVQKLARSNFRPCLESLEERLNLSTYTVSSLADSGPGSLRAAITSVNGDTTADVIDFSVAGVIQLTSGPLPTITNPVNIDGTSAPGFAGAPVVEIDNHGFAGLVFGYSLSTTGVGAAGSTLRSLSIVHANGPGVTLQGLAGTLHSLPVTDNITVAGNYIGLTLDGSVAANTGVGLFVDGSFNDTIGGTAAADRNVISGNGAGGIKLSGQNSKVLGNFIGTDPSGQAAAPNQGNGITVLSFFNAIGGTVSGAGNIIAFNSQYGIVVDTGYENAIRENSIFNNDGGGILLTNGANLNQPAPVLTTAYRPTPATIEVDGALTVPPNEDPTRSYDVEIFATPPGAPAGQGQIFMGSLNVVPNAAGIAPFVFRSALASGAGYSFTATATNHDFSNTSAFSNAIAISSPTPNQIYIANVYQLLLNRQPDPGAAAWVDDLNQGVSPVAVLIAIEGSEEYITDQVDALYMHYLNRPADPQGRQYWVGVVQAGGTFEQVAEGLASSQEYYKLHGGTNDGFISGLYVDVLNRGATTPDLDIWEPVLNSGASRASVAAYFLASQEYRADLVKNDYATFLHRAADPGGVTFWVDALNAGAKDQQVLAAIFGSPEAYQLWS